MKTKMLLLCFLFVGHASFAADKDSEAAKPETKAEGKAEAKPAVDIPEGASTVTCESANETRILINKPVGKGCEVSYDRNGERSIAGGAKNDLTYCAKIVEKIQGNLEKAGFKCKK